MKELFSSIGSVITALCSSTCCLGPAIFTGLGVGAGTAGALSGLAGFTKAMMPYRSVFIIRKEEDCRRTPSGRRECEGPR